MQICNDYIDEMRSDSLVLCNQTSLAQFRNTIVFKYSHITSLLFTNYLLLFTNHSLLFINYYITIHR